MRRAPALLVTLLAATAAAFAFGAAPASAKQPCWRALFVDYADGRIDKTYPVKCYRDAVKHLQEDTLTYGSAAEDINRALQAALIKLGRGGGPPAGPNTPVPPEPGGTLRGAGQGKKHDEGFFDRLAHAIGPNSADAVPLPLLILAGLAMLLLAGAATSLIARRVQARRGPPRPPETPS